MKNPETNEYSAEFTPQESVPLLSVLSKLSAIAPVSDTEFTPFKAWPHICWAADKSANTETFAPVGRALRDSKTQLAWFITYEVPYFCIFAQPRQEGAPYIAWPQKTPDLSGPELSRLRAVAADEISALSGFLEDHLNLRNHESLGLELKPRDMGLPGITDYSSPRYKNVFLTADPESFSPYQGKLTSENDRALHYGLTAEETSALELAVLQDKSRDYSVIRNFFYEPYQDQRVLPGEIDMLKHECEDLTRGVTDKDAGQALKKILSLGESAQRYKLGIFLDSN